MKKLDKAVVATGHPLVSGAAIEILKKGGNAFDAAGDFYWPGRTRAKKYSSIFSPIPRAEVIPTVNWNRISFLLPFTFLQLTRILTLVWVPLLCQET
jgi:hypothetical protein